MKSVERLINVARGQVGYHEGYFGGHWTNHQKYSPAVPGLEWSQDQAWCQTFQSWNFQEAGLKSLAPVTASCLTAVSWFKQRGRFSEYPAVGAQVFFGQGGGSHVGLVYAYDANYSYTIEGNTNATGSAEGDGVYLKKRLRRDAYLYGYGYPRYTEGIVSADPRYAGGTGTPSVPPPTPTQPVIPLREIVNAAVADPPAEDGHTTNYASVIVVERALAAEGLLEPRYVDGSFGTKTVAAYAVFQRRLGYAGADADGVPGRASLSELGRRRGFTVT